MFFFFLAPQCSIGLLTNSPHSLGEDSVIKQPHYFLKKQNHEVLEISNSPESFNPLTAKHHINANLLYEYEERLRIKFEAYYIGRQYLSTRELTR
jgi:hypothetical protein